MTHEELLRELHSLKSELIRLARIIEAKEGEQAVPPEAKKTLERWMDGGVDVTPRQRAITPAVEPMDRANGLE